jgi:hypothetical protein
MFDKMLGGVFRRADRVYKENLVHRTKAVDASPSIVFQEHWA